MRERKYEVDDEDYIEHRVNGGTLSRAEFFTERLGMIPDNSKGKYADSDPLLERIKRSLEE